MYMCKEKKGGKKKPAAPGLTATGTRGAPTPWKCKDYAEHNPMVLVQRTEHLIGKSRNLFLRPNFITRLANYFTLSCFDLSVGRGQQY